MKLGKILPYIDCGVTVRIYDQIGAYGSDKWEIVYEGYAYHIPWIYVNRKLIKAEDNDYNEAICPYIDKDGNPAIRITLAEEY